MATIAEKFNQIDSQEIKIRLAHLLDFMKKHKDQGVVFMGLDKQENETVALTYELDEELIQHDLDMLVSYGLAVEEYNAEIGARIISAKPTAMNVAQEFLFENDFPDMPARTYHIYQLEIDTEDTEKVPTIIVVRHNPYDIHNIAHISDVGAGLMDLAPDVVKGMNKQHKELRKAITKVSNEKPIAFHLSPEEWNIANHMHPPLCVLIEKADYAQHIIHKGPKNRGDLSKRQIKNINHAYKDDALEAISHIKSLLGEVRHDYQKEREHEADIHNKISAQSSK